MFNKLKAKFAAKRIQRIKDFADTDKKIKKNESQNKQMLLRPFRLIGRGIRWCWDNLVCILSWIWECICEINFIGLLNLTLLIAIIVLFSLLITNVTNCNKKSVVVMTPAREVSVKYTQNPTLPLKRETKTAQKQVSNIKCQSRNIKTTSVQQIKRPTVYGDTIIEMNTEKQILQRGTVINGNLYLQNMRKYVLPCDVQINGNLFLRNVGMLQFCGKFNVSGNIYVGPTSSFGPLPRDAVLGGQVIL